jgi:hypothetical protein
MLQRIYRVRIDNPVLAPSSGLFITPHRIETMVPNTNRNRLIFVAFSEGRSAELIGKDYALTNARVRAILTDERNKRSVSPHPFYRDLRRV